MHYHIQICELVAVMYNNLVHVFHDYNLALILILAV